MRSREMYSMLAGRFLAAHAAILIFIGNDYIERGSAIEREYG